ncbi:UNVERIFIED_CONTAM: hypothetical protein GTU68_016784 [Idotea baltica]|nr:hypothetical protein [Idotea baltica]
MKKAPQAFRTISEVSDWLETPTHVLRFWESKFSQIKPVKRAGGRRYYRPADMKLLGGIKTLLHGDGITIKAAQKILSDKGVKHVSELSPELDFPEKGRRRKQKTQTPPADVQAETDPTQDKEEIVADTSTPPAPSAPIVDETPVFASSQMGEQDIKRPVEQDAKDRINAAVDQKTDTAAENAPVMDEQVLDAPVDAPVMDEPVLDTHVEIAPIADAPITDTPVVNESVAMVERTRKSISNVKQRHALNDDQIMDVEDLFYRLKKVRNRMKRALNQLS